VGEYVADHHEYFRDNLNYNKDDCCNLKLNISKKQIATQLNIF
jgi:hypothetical protein